MCVCVCVCVNKLQFLDVTLHGTHSHPWAING